MAPIRKGDGTPLEIPGVSEVRSGDGRVFFEGDAIADTHAYLVEDFAEPWPDAVGDVDMSVSGLSTSTFDNGEDSVSADGSSHGLANISEFFSQQTFGIAFTIATTDDGFEDYMSVHDGSRFNFGTNENRDPVGNLYWNMVDENSNLIGIYTDENFSDGSVRPVVINKNGDSANDMSMFVGDMETEQSVIIDGDDSGFDHQDVNITEELAFFARNEDGTIRSNSTADMGAIEFNSSPLDESQRQSFVDSRPEV